MAENLIGQTLNNRYEITERIGVGGMAEVYRAQDNVLGRTVAVKVMLPQYAENPSFAARFKQEASSAANLSSPYIVNIYDWGQDPATNTYFIVMEYVRGSDLKTAIKQRGAINQRKVAEIGSQVCQALSVAHKMDIIHRDIKPQNIMVQPDGNVKVMDFGIARAKNSDSDKTAVVLGTAHYISPEQAQGKDLTSASDIYSLGIVMYESVTGQLPFDAPDAVSVAMKQVQEEPELPSEINPNIDPSLEAIIMKAIAKDPQERFDTAQDMRTALNDYLAGRPVSLNSFNDARTSVIVPPVTAAETAAFAAASEGGATAVMPSVGNSKEGSTTAVSRNYRNDGSGNGKSGLIKKNDNKKTIGIIVAVVAALAVAAAVAFAIVGRGAGDITVPDVTGVTQEEAKTKLEAAGLSVGTITEIYSDDVEAGKVISQTPSADSKAKDGDKVNLTISQGSEQVTVPDLTGKTPSEARAELQKLGLKYASGESEYSDTVEKNKVARQDPESGEKVSKGSTVTYFLSAGEEGVEVPNVVGMSERAATTTLSDADFQVSIQYQSSSTVAQGNVIEQTPTAGSSQKKGDTVNLTISTGISQHSVSASAGAGGTVTPSSVTVDDGSSATFTVTPKSGYTVSNVYDEYGEYYTVSKNGGKFTIENVTDDTTITVEFEATSTNTDSSDGNSNTDNTDKKKTS